jgi:hypothetical protein
MYSVHTADGLEQSEDDDDDDEDDGRDESELFVSRCDGGGVLLYSRHYIILNFVIIYTYSCIDYR